MGSLETLDIWHKFSNGQNQIECEHYFQVPCNFCSLKIILEYAPIPLDSQIPELGLFTVVNYICCDDAMFGTLLVLDACGFDPGKIL